MGLVRIFLAIVVAVGHWQLLILSPRNVVLSRDALLNAAHAVLFFYTISGFLITYTLSQNYTRSPAGFAQFYANRFIRIFSLYWPVFILVLLLVSQARSSFFGGKVVDQFTSLFLFGVDWRWSFGAAGGQYTASTLLSLQQAWTLGAELTFYLLAPFLMASRRLAVAILLGSLALRIAFIAIDIQPEGLWNYTFFPTTVVFFLLGHFAAKIGDYWSALANPRVGLALVILSFLDMTLMHQTGLDDSRFWTSMLLFAAGLSGLFNVTKNSRLLNWLGNLSYPLYLVHLLVITLFGESLSALTTHWVGGGTPFAVVSVVMFILLAACVSIGVHYILEVPLSRFMRIAVSKFLKPQNRGRHVSV